MTTPESRRPTLMVVHAHPDDEASQTGGTLARYAAAGFRTVLITCTDGGQGDGAGGAKPGHHRHDPEQVAARRSKELALSAVALGLTDLIQLEYPDSGMAESVDETAFSKLDGEPIVQRLEALMHDYQPDVVVTYPPNGLSYHPDHIRTHELTVAALARIKQVGGFEKRSRTDAASVRVVPRLYYIAVSVSRLKTLRAQAEAVLEPGAWIPPLEIGVADDTVTTAVNVSAFWAEKLRALAAHASQADAAALLHALSVPQRQDPVEEYVRADPPWAGDRQEDDLFTGIPGVL
ncbi:PIG-L family deacetylase [Streptomyces sp. NBC_00365]|uniref:PIG-L deacetylase family protein n=1 Tax=Streptomyces sp. NBC_00365 TaxID=2975726 RepID=UPI0022582289|nr:PIG-L family deacetylase [Streptomyces sp. NBC_00365]MCX5096933.1 PIG-L family deacetylase [Streptomyces sp. NBC_00365]